VDNLTLLRISGSLHQSPKRSMIERRKIHQRKRRPGRKLIDRRSHDGIIKQIRLQKTSGFITIAIQRALHLQSVIENLADELNDQGIRRR
jgi:hypothetical protein